MTTLHLPHPGAGIAVRCIAITRNRPVFQVHAHGAFWNEASNVFSVIALARMAAQLKLSATQLGALVLLLDSGMTWRACARELGIEVIEMGAVK